MSKKGSFQRQHYISRVLIRRFATNGVVQKFFVNSGKWKEAGLDNTFSHDGYTQMLSNGIVDNTLEQVFGKVEKLMPQTLAALYETATRERTSLPEKLYCNFCWYLAFLHCLSPFFKAKCPVDFLHDLHIQIINGGGDLLDVYLRMTQEERIYFRHWILQGQKLIIDSENYLQLLHRIQFKRTCRELYYNTFRFVTTWHVCRSPIELPLSDVAITEMRHPEIHWYSLPISPRLLLVGRVPQIEANVPSNQTVIHSLDLPPANAENWKDLICLQARLALVGKGRFADVIERRQRAVANGHRFANIQSIENVLASGTQDFSKEFSFKMVSPAKFEDFCRQFVTD